MIFFLLMLWRNNCFVQMCLLIGTVSQVSDVAKGPLGSCYSKTFLESIIIALKYYFNPAMNIPIT